MTKLFFIKIIWVLFFYIIFSLKLVWAGELFVEQVFKNIFMVSPQGFEGTNSVFIVTDEGVLLVDSGNSPDEALKILAEIRRHTMKPVRFLINTHYFGSHTFGNSIFRNEGAVIIGHRNVQRALAGKRGKMELKRLENIGILGLDRSVIVPPNMVFEKRLEIILGGYQIHLISLGRALTDGDVLVYLPDFKTLIAGGIVSNKVIPRLAESDIENWVKILGTFDNFKIEIILPGSGPIGEKPTAIQMRHYLLDLKEQILFQKGGRLQEISRKTLSFFKKKYGNWKKQNRMEDNIRKVFKDLISQ